MNSTAIEMLRRELGEPGNPNDSSPVWETFRTALESETDTRLACLIGGIRAYRMHHYRRLPESQVSVWQEGTTRLLQHGDGDGRPLLLVPSLINRFHVLDLLPERSLLDHLDQSGFAPYVVDWNQPGSEERGFCLTDYVAGRLEQALDATLELSGRRPGVIGYCMGGLLALALAQRRRRDLTGLVLLATPWDFHADADMAPSMIQASRPLLETIIDTNGVLPTDIIQSMFFALDPLLAVRKFLEFGQLDMTSPQAVAFVALEDWINDGVPLAGPVARETLFGWYGANTPGREAWQIAGQVIAPSRVNLPCLTLVPSRDHIVPPVSAAVLAEAIPGATKRQTPLGHIGMVVSGQAREKSWNIMVDWLNERVS